MSEELRDLHDRIGATTIYVTHDQLEAMSMADQIAVMNQGVVEQIGAPQEIYDLPATMFVADFVGSPPMNFMPLRGRGSSRRPQRCSSAGPASPSRRFARRTRRNRSCSACGPSMSRFPTRRRSAGRVFGDRVSRHDADRDRRYRAGPDQGAAAVDVAGASRRDGGPRVQVRVADRCSMRATGRAMRSALHQGERAMAEIGLSHVSKRFGADRGRARSFAHDRRRRVRRAAGPDRRGQDHDACA